MKKQNTFANLDNPALLFINKGKEETEGTRGAAAQSAQEHAPVFDYKKEKRATKTRRMQFVFTDEIAEKLKARAKEEETSMNDLVCKLLEKFL